jgi:hypothetical protein
MTTIGTATMIATTATIGINWYSSLEPGALPGSQQSSATLAPYRHRKPTNRGTFCATSANFAGFFQILST